MLGLAGLFHEAQSVMTSGNLGPHGVVPDLATNFEDPGNFVGFSLRAVAVVVVLFAVVLLSLA